MIFNVPISTELVSTSVTDTTPVFDENAVYEDGDLVRKDDNIYSVAVIYVNEDTMPLDVFGSYAIGDRMLFDDGLVYSTIKAFSAQPNDGTVMAYYNPGGGLMTNIVYLSFGVFISDQVNVYSGHMSVGATTSERNTFTPISGDEYTYLVETVQDSDGTVIDSTSTTVTIHPSWTSSLVGGDFLAYGGTLYKVYEADVQIPYTQADLLSDGYVVASSTFKVRTYTLGWVGLPNDAKPFDAKQYSSVIVAGQQTWTIKSLKKFDGLALGYLRGLTVTVVFKNAAGTIVSTVSAKTIDGSIDANIEDERISEIIYAGQFIDAYGTIEITIDGAETEVGMIFPTASVEVGLTNLKFSHDVKNFDREEISSISGFVDRVRGNRVIYYKGSFDIEMTAYDKMLLLSKKLTNELIAVDGSDMKDNATADGQGTFAATKLICSVSQLKTASEVKDGDMERVVPISFEFKEIV